MEDLDATIVATFTVRNRGWMNERVLSGPSPQKRRRWAIRRPRVAPALRGI
jgi:hypothetical protein